jgi:plastocyanin
MHSRSQPHTADSSDADRRLGRRVPALSTRRRLLIVMVALSSLLVLARLGDQPPSAQAQGATGSIRGRVDIRRIVTAPQARPNVSGLSSQTTLDGHDLQRAVVFLDAQEVPERSPLRAAPRAAAGRARMDQRNETFSPHVLAITTGTIVEFPNNDQTFHNVFSLSKPRRFDLGRYGRNESKALRFDKPGIVRVFCDIHSHMSAFVLVFNHPFHTTTSDDGRYRLDHVPPGTYTVTVWHEGQSRDSRSVTVTASGGVFDVDLLVQ